jgi:hypothetical protein
MNFASKGGQDEKSVQLSPTRLRFALSCCVRSMSADLSTGYLAVTYFAVSGSNLFVVADSGVFLIADNGASWTADNSGLPQNLCVHTLVVSHSGQCIL